MNELAILVIIIVAFTLVWAAGYVYGKYIGLVEAVDIVRDGKEDL